jgi:hypothetical protein
MAELHTLPPQSTRSAKFLNSACRLNQLNLRRFSGLCNNRRPISNARQFLPAAFACHEAVTANQSAQRSDVKAQNEAGRPCALHSKGSGRFAPAAPKF